MPLLVGIVGSGGFAREIMPVARSVTDADERVFVERAQGAQVNGHRVMAEADFLAFDGERRFAVGVGDGAIRARVQAAYEAAGALPLSLVAAEARVFDGNSIGSGAVICPFAMVTSNVVIGRGFQANLYSYVAHDCLVGDFVTLAPGAKVNGNVEIGDFAYLGTGCIIRQGTSGRRLRIGAGAVVGMGAVVTRDVADGETVIGNPARRLEKRD